MTVVLIDGRRVPPEEASVSVFDRGFLYGDSVFETLRTYGGRPFELAAHLLRLARSAERVLIPMPVSLSVLSREVEQGLAARGEGESMIRIMITRGRAGSLGLDPGLARDPLRVILLAPLEIPRASDHEDGVKVITYKTERVTEATTAVGAKVANYLVAVLGTHAARLAGAREALVLDAQGFVIEGTTSNVFIVKQGALVTPPEEAGILAGITRGIVLELAEELGIGVELRPLPLMELHQADEVFICSTLKELMPVTMVDDRSIAGRRPGPVTLRLLQAFREKAKETSQLSVRPRS